MKNKTKRQLIFDIVFYTFIALMYVMIIVGLIFKYTKNPNFSVFGYNAYVVISPSMSRANEAHKDFLANTTDDDRIQMGDLIVTKRITDKSQLIPYAVVTFYLGDDVVVHRIVDTVEVDGEIKYRTRGDANDSDDGLRTYDQFYGIVVKNYGTTAGMIVGFIQSTYGIAAFAGVGFVGFLTAYILSFFKKKEANADEPDEENNAENCPTECDMDCNDGVTAFETDENALPDTEQTDTVDDGCERDHDAESANTTSATITCDDDCDEYANFDDTEPDAESDDDDGAQDRFAFARNIKRTPFAQKVMSLSDDKKAYYTAIDNELCSYKSVRARTSVACRSYRIKRKLIAKLTVRGKTLVLYLALDVTEHKRSVYFHRDSSDKKAYSAVPFTVRVKTPRTLKNALRLVSLLAEKHDLRKTPDFSPTDGTSLNRPADK